MALKGNLRDFGVAQLLNLINLARKTGTLTIEGPEQAAWISFRDGSLVYAQLGSENGTLTSILTKVGKLAPNQAKAIMRSAESRGDKELGLMLINAGYVTQQDILTSIRRHVLDSVYQLFTWIEGFFRFDPGVLPPQDRITIRADLENVIVEGSRRVREWEQLVEEIPNLDMALDFVERPGANIRNVNLNIDEWNVVSYINPKNSLRQIAKQNRLSEIQIRRIVFGLLQAGLVEFVRPEGMPLPPEARRIQPMDRKQQTSLVNRLIERIRSL
ncbi:MAG: DUF4388 domain-containing protein [Anaerolineales bacterium]|jgi:hypothetical protein